MALSSYTELQAAVGAWSFNRTDLPASDLIRLGEARLSRDLVLRAMETETALEAQAGERTLPLPAGFAAPVALWREPDGEGRREALARVLPSLAVSTVAGVPESWTIDGETIAFERPCERATRFVLRWRAGLALSPAQPTNWLLERHPDAYLAAALVEAALWAADDEQAARWQARYQAAVDAINTLERRAREAPLRTEIAGLAGADNPKG